MCIVVIVFVLVLLFQFFVSRQQHARDYSSKHYWNDRYRTHREDYDWYIDF